LISQVVLIGDRLPYVTALFTINTAQMDQLAGAKGKKLEVKEHVQNAVTKVNKQLPPFEQIRKFKILERDFTIEDGEMTPTMKVRRNRVLENFRPLVTEMYMGKEEMQ
jgi:long-chain acyl-CoA synthetase